jgi:hypothetical protein
MLHGFFMFVRLSRTPALRRYTLLQKRPAVPGAGAVPVKKSLTK